MRGKGSALMTRLIRLLQALYLFSAPTMVCAEVLVPAKFSDQSPREDIRKKIFPEGTPDKACKIISKDPSGVVEVDPGLSPLRRERPASQHAPRRGAS